MDAKTQKELNDKLQVAAEAGNAAEVASLLAKGAEIDCRHCTEGCRETPLMKAAQGGHREVIRLLLEKGADKALSSAGAKTAEDMARNFKHLDLADFLHEYGEKKSPDKVIFSDKIGMAVRENIYDFVMRERVTLIRSDKFGPVEAMNIIGFSALEDQSDDSMLRKAFNEHVSRGGKADESVIFPNRLVKSLTRRPS